MAKLGKTFVLPLLLSPLLAAGIGLLVYRLLRQRLAQAECACLITPNAIAPSAVMAGADNALQIPQPPPMPQLIVASNTECDQLTGPGQAQLKRWSIPHALDYLHIASASLICFARAVNDTPKLAALLVAVPLLSAQASLVLIAAAMVFGGLVLSQRVAQTMSQRVTRMNTTQGLSANLITAVLVLSASQFALPVSTTHVSVGAIAGVGVSGNTLKASALKAILLSWLATLPMAAAIAWLAYQWLK